MKIKSKTSLIVICCVVATVLVVAGAGIGILLSGSSQEAEPVAIVAESVEAPVSGRGTVITEENVEEILAARNTADTERFAHYLVSMTTDWVFETADAPSTNMYVINDTNNPGTVFFDVVLDDEIVFSSPYIPLGARLDSITLEADVPPGVHRPTVVYHLVDEYYEVQASLSVEITLRILG